jgi:diacylglycerol O-acyltransferase-1
MSEPEPQSLRSRSSKPAAQEGKESSGSKPARHEHKASRIRAVQNFHRSCRPSPLSAEAKDQNYRGLVNLAAIVLVVANLRAAVENMLRYGWRIQLPQDPLSSWPTTWPGLTCFLCLPLFVVAAFGVEALAWRRFINNTLATLLHSLVIIVAFAVPIWVIQASHATVFSGMTLMLGTLVVFLKLVSYAHVSGDARALRADPAALKQLDEENSQAGGPDSDTPMSDVRPCDCSAATLAAYTPTLSHALYFLAAPTLCYQLEYPRSPFIRWRFVARRVGELVFCGGLMIFFIEQYIQPAIDSSFVHIENLNMWYLFERVLKLAVPCLCVWLLMFYALFHSYFNLIAELLRFGDRLFYKAWWNSATLEEYWKLWNLPVHSWCVRHLYAPLLRVGLSPMASLFVVFTFSAVMHEVLISIPTHAFHWYAFAAMMAQIPIIVITKLFFRSLSHSSFEWLGNVFFWLSFCIFGQPICVLLYTYQYEKTSGALA